MEFNSSGNTYPTGYFIASQDGQHFSHVPSDSIKDLLVRQFIVYYIDYGTPLTSITTEGSGPDHQLSGVLPEPPSSVVLLDNHPAQNVTGTSSEAISTSQLLVHQPVDLDGVLLPTYDALQSDGAVTSLPDASKPYSRSSARRKPVQRVCPVCNEAFTTKKAYTLHLSKHEEGKPYKCPNCPQSFNYSNNLTIHIALEKTSDPPYKCPICQQLCSRLSAFKSHLLLHQVDDHLQCPICQISFTTQCLLDVHTKTEHQNPAKQPDPVYRCRVCQVALPTNGQLRKHYLLHHASHRATTHHVSPVRSCIPPATADSNPQPEMSQQQNSFRRSKTEALSFLTRVLGPKKSLHDVPTSDSLIQRVELDSSTLPVSPILLRNLRRRKFRGSRSLKGPLYKCPVCGQKFTHLTRAKMHMLHHVNKKPFECLICHLRFAEKSSARAHVIRHNRPLSRSVCPICQRTFTRQSALLRHLKNHHEEYSFEVLDPDRWTTEWVLQESHPQSNTIVPPLTSASVTGLHNQEPNSAYAQFSVSTALIPSQLPVGEAVEIVELNGVPDQQNISRQVLSSAAKPFQCRVCKKSFSRSRTLSIHMLRHPSISLPYSCSQCPLRFSTTPELKYHLRDHTLRTRSRIKLVRQEKSRSSDGPLKWDRASHRFINIRRSKCRPFKCLDCPNSYRSKIHLEYHIRQRHRLELAPYVCHTCHKRFVTESRLRQHADSVHSNTMKPNYVCLLCAASFSCRSSLKRHMVIHSGERPYKCTICHKLFKFYASCQRHMKLHLDNTQGSDASSFHYSPANQYDPCAIPNMTDDVGTTIHHQQTQHIVDLDQEFVQNISPQLCSITPAQICLVPVSSSFDTNQNCTSNDCIIQSVNMGSCAPSALSLTVDYVKKFGQNLAQFSCEDLGHDSPRGVLYSEQPVATCFHSNGNDPDSVDISLHHIVPQYCNSHPNSLLATTLKHLVPPAHRLPSLDGYQKLDTANSSAVPNYSGFVPPMLSQADALTDEARQINSVDVTVLEAPEQAQLQPPTSAAITVDTNNESCQNPDSDSAGCHVSVEVMLFGCGLCSESFDTAAQLRLHVDTSHAVQPKLFACDSCQLSFVSETLLLAHKTTHFEPQGELQTTHRCPSCPLASFNNKSALTRHILACHPLPTPDRFRCTSCDARFRLLRSLVAHVAKFKNGLNGGCLKIPKMANRIRAKHQKAGENMDPELLKIRYELPERSASDLGSSEKISTATVSQSDSGAEPSISNKGVTNQRRIANSSCPICSKEFKLTSDLKRHMWTHTFARPFRCNECNSQFTRHSRLRHHIQRAHASEDVTTISVEVDGISLQITRVCANGYICHACGGKCSSITELRSHLQLHVAKRQLYCHRCNVACATPAERQTHLLHCNVSSQSHSKTSFDLVDDLTPSGGASTRQSIGSNQVSNFMVPSVHISEASDSTQMQVVCSSGEPGTNGTHDSHFPSNEPIAAYITNITPAVVDNGPKSSQVDPTHSQNSDDTVQNVVEFVPDGPESNTISNNNLQPYDMFTQPECTSVVSYKCPPTSHTVPVTRRDRWRKRRKKSTTSSSLQRLFRCSTCHMEFSRRASLTRHERTHTNYRPYVCAQCKACFTQSYALTRHLIVHTSERPFKCNRCQVSFRARISMRRHLEKVHA
ncbi:hypothetical protein CSKR_107070 [Clonorchis sinensis]|uniref:C2H2-type domain-containing protein n=1 Tax=Clonorchis sinensis TaxID=79923 RepID=A0A419PD55_CLOSI|nr:hypothetical protein CSKR_107070 [Clonorchis sinensis]